jgi:hypothetical protein
MTPEQKRYLKRKERTKVKIDGDKLNSEILDLEGDPIARTVDARTGDTVKAWTYRSLLLNLVHSSKADGTDGDLLWSAGQAIAACRESSQVCELEKSEAKALIKAAESQAIGIRMPVKELLTEPTPAKPKETEDSKK